MPKKKRVQKARISVIDYSSNKSTEKVLKKIEDAFPFKNRKSVTWVNIDGVKDQEVIKKIGKRYGIHSLVLEDISNTNQRPKIEYFDNHIFIIARMISFDSKKNKISSEQISIIFGKNFVISFQEKQGDIFDPIRKRIKEKGSRIRNLGSEYLTYSILDSIVDNYFNVLEEIGEKIEKFEEDLIADPHQKLLKDIYKLKREILYLRKSVWPLREVVSNLERSESRLISKRTGIYIRDLYDHTIQVIDTIETFRDTIAGMLDLYLSSVSNRMNEVMKVLTIIATIFIPLTFVTGVYGMNFKYMPELESPIGYFVTWGIMILLGLMMLVYFKKKRWM